jgi:molecular chaperone GrpE
MSGKKTKNKKDNASKDSAPEEEIFEDPVLGDNIADNIPQDPVLGDGVVPDYSEVVEEAEIEEPDPIEALKGECEQLKDQALRAAAEVENMRRRTERELGQARKYGHSGFARDLLSVVENLKRAVDALPEDRKALDDTMANLVAGVEMINHEINTVLEKHGVEVINPMGEKFDYEKHQAMFEVPTDEAEPGTVMQVAQRGWMLHDRLLTPAMVGVSKAPEEDKSGK